jgi:hypothetical protein
MGMVNTVLLHHDPTQWQRASEYTCPWVNAVPKNKCPKMALMRVIGLFVAVVVRATV